MGVLIDGKYIKVKDANGSVTTKFVPRSEAELKAYEELVKSAVGFDPKRGDKVTVISVPFETSETQMGAFPSKKQKNMTLYLALGGLAFVLIALLGYLVVRSRKLKQARIEAEQMAALKGASLEQAAAQAREEGFSIEREPAYKRVLEISKEHPELVADMISKWIKEENSK